MQVGAGGFLRDRAGAGALPEWLRELAARPENAGALALTTDCTPRYVLADPEAGGAQAVAGSVWPRSASLPAIGEATAPDTPTRAKMAIPVCDRWKAGLASIIGVTVQNRLKQANMAAW